MQWTFDADGAMLPTASTPFVAGQRLYVGEGMHGNFMCRLHCVDVATGTARWAFESGDHIEGGPVEAGGTLYFSAGNDGLYAIDSTTGVRRWNFRADLHIDSSPSVADGRVFCGSGKSRRFNDLPGCVSRRGLR